MPNSWRTVPTFQSEADQFEPNFELDAVRGSQDKFLVRVHGHEKLMPNLLSSVSLRSASL
jgi:hypothetical protein